MVALVTALVVARLFDPASKTPVDKDEREQYCTEAILRPCAYRESPNGT